MAAAPAVAAPRLTRQEAQEQYAAYRGHLAGLLQAAHFTAAEREAAARYWSRQHPREAQKCFQSLLHRCPWSEEERSPCYVDGETCTGADCYTFDTTTADRGCCAGRHIYHWWSERHGQGEPVRVRDLLGTPRVCDVASLYRAHPDIFWRDFCAAPRDIVRDVHTPTAGALLHELFAARMPHMSADELLAVLQTEALHHFPRPPLDALPVALQADRHVVLTYVLRTPALFAHPAVRRFWLDLSFLHAFVKERKDSVIPLSFPIAALADAAGVQEALLAAVLVRAAPQLFDSLPPERKTAPLVLRLLESSDTYALRLERLPHELRTDLTFLRRALLLRYEYVDAVRASCPAGADVLFRAALCEVRFCTDMAFLWCLPERHDAAFIAAVLRNMDRNRVKMFLYHVCATHLRNARVLAAAFQSKYTFFGFLEEYCRTGALVDRRPSADQLRINTHALLFCTPRIRADADLEREILEEERVVDTCRTPRHFPLRARYLMRAQPAHAPRLLDAELLADVPELTWLAEGRANATAPAEWTRYFPAPPPAAELRREIFGETAF